MKIFAISDLHLSTAAPKPMDIFGTGWTDYMDKITEDWKKKVSDEDVVLIAGDISWAMQLEDALSDFALLKPLKGKKVFIRGNHDYWWKSISKIRAALPPDFYVLQNDCLRINDLLILGTRGWTVEGSPDFTEEDKKIYLRENERLKLALKDMQKQREDGDKVIAMIHYPPFNVRRDNSLFTELFKQYGVNAVVYGHLHGNDCKADKIVVKDGVYYYLTSCDLVKNQLVEITF